MRNVKTQLIKSLVLLALVLPGFVHGATSNVSTDTGFHSSVFAAQHRLPDGTFSVICNRDENNGHAKTAFCEFCFIASNAMLAGPETSIKTRFSVVLTSGSQESSSTLSRHPLYRLHAPLRAPPVLAA